MADEIKPIETTKPVAVSVTTPAAVVTTETKSPAGVTTTTISPQEAFLGIGGKFRYWANLGIAGVMCGLIIYLVMVAMPSERDAYRHDINSEREAGRSEAEKSRAHGSEMGKEIGGAIREQTKETTGNQRELILQQKQLIELHKKAMMMQKMDPEDLP